MRPCSTCVLSLLVLAGTALADPVVPGATVTLLGTLPAGYRPYSIDVGEDPTGPDGGRWLYFGCDNNIVTGVPLVRMSLGTGATGDAATAGAQHVYSTAVYDADGILVDFTGTFTGEVGSVIVACSNPNDGAGQLWKINPAAGDAGGGQSTVRQYVSPLMSINNCDTMTVDGQGRLYIDVPTYHQIDRMVGLPVNNGGTFETFATLSTTAGTIVYDGQGRIWCSGGDGVIRRIPIEGTLPHTEADALQVNVGTGIENGLAWTHATPQSGGGAWGGGVLVVRRGTGNGELVRLRSNTVAQDLLGTGMGDVYGMTVDLDGVLYAADYSSGQVWKIVRNNRLGCGPGDIGGTGGVPTPDGQLSNDDFIVFIDFFFSHDARADRGGTGGVPLADGAWDNNDFVVFIDDFFAGC
jgi:hypothetical protein